MENNYVYPAKMNKTSEGYGLTFIDFDIYVEEKSIDSVVNSAQEALALTIIDFLDNKKSLPKASYQKNATYIQIWLPYYKAKTEEIYVRKNVTIPQWLDIIAKEKNINFSAALVYGIKEFLGLN